MSTDTHRTQSIHSLSTHGESRPASTQTRSWWTRGIIGLVAVALIVGATSVVRSSSNPGQASSVLTHTIRRADLNVTVTEEGTLESSGNKEIKCRVKGGSTVLWIIEPGTTVKPGDVLVRLDTSTIEDNINQQKINYQIALAIYAQSQSDVAVAKINIEEYEEGTYRSEKMTLLKDQKVAESQLLTAKDTLNHSKKMAGKGYISKLQLKSDEDAVEHKELELEVIRTNLEVLDKYTKKKNLEELNGIFKAKEAKLASDKAALDLEKARLDRDQRQLENCVIKSEATGMVMLPSMAEWKEQPEVEEGANVREDQVLLIIPDLDDMQVKVGIHESRVDQLSVGMPARVKLQDSTINGKILSIASITKPAGWWTGNMVKYDTVIKIDKPGGIKPGMSAAVEVVLAAHANVLTIPVAAVVEVEEGDFCWIKTATGSERRTLRLGDSDEQFIVVEDGLKEGDQVILNPLAHIDEAQRATLKPLLKTQKPAEANESKSTVEGSKPQSDSASSNEPKPKVTGKAIMKMADKNGDGVLTRDEFSEKDRDSFEKRDLNSDGKVDESELDAAIEKPSK